MWDIKLQNLEIFKDIFCFVHTFLIFIINLFINYSQISISIKSFSIFYTFTFNNSIVFGIKFLVCIAFLVLIRGGTPRYRYDYLTKLGWLKFINIIIFIFFFSIFFFFLF